MNKEEVLKTFPDYEEITQQEYEQLPYCYGCYVLTITKDTADEIMKDLCIYLKPKQKFPIVFEKFGVKILVDEEGWISIKDFSLLEGVRLNPLYLELFENAIIESKKITDVK